MNQKNFSLTAGVLFLIIAFLHLLRIALGWHAVIGGVVIPLWASWLALFVAGYLAYQGINLGKESHKN